MHCRKLVQPWEAADNFRIPQESNAMLSLGHTPESDKRLHRSKCSMFSGTDAFWMFANVAHFANRFCCVLEDHD